MARNSIQDIAAGPPTRPRPAANQPEEKWPVRRTFLFVFVSSALDWSAIIYLATLLVG